MRLYEANCTYINTNDQLRHMAYEISPIHYIVDQLKNISF